MVRRKRKKNLFFFQAREWISPATTLWMMTEILKRYKAEDPVIRPILKKITVHFLPVVNPDGYIHSFSSRMWRKNRFKNHDVTQTQKNIKI